MAQRYFGTDGIRGQVGTYPMSPDFILKLGWAAGRVLSKYGTGKAVIGKDTRISGYMYESALEAGLAAAGIDTYLLGPIPTPGIAYLTRTLGAQLGVVISASHNPYYDNGIKFFSAKGTKLSTEIELEIEAELEKEIETVESAKLGKAKRIEDAQGRYIEFCKSTVSNSMSLKGLRIVVDCAHGATYNIAPSVFRELSAEVIPIGVSPNGTNINDGVGSTYPANLAGEVLKHRADIGISLDGDGDRLIMVDHTGEIVDGDEIVYIMAMDSLRKKKHGDGIVGTLMSNLGLELALKEAGFKFERADVGDKYVLEKLIENKWSIGGESSGHILSLSKTTTGDGIVSALQVLSAMMRSNKSLHELKKGMSKYPQQLINVRIANKVDPYTSEAVQNIVKDAQASMADKGRVLLRTSGTEPLIRVMVEAEDMELVEKWCKSIADVVTAEFA
ncbi:MAG: phosphoglucosamine mutase [Gammaproteobacteria bacterium]|nr:phosphoglucosamine mutase [Gammaproteobacteria bacterium]